MNKKLRKHLIDTIYSGHRHPEMQDWLRCRTCGVKFQKWDFERKRLKKLYPKEFEKKKEEYTPSKRTENYLDQLQWRLKRDEDYRNSVKGIWVKP